MRRTFRAPLAISACLLLLACEAGPTGLTGARSPFFAFGVSATPAPGATAPAPVEVAARPPVTPGDAPSAAPTPSPTATPRRSSGGGGSRRSAPVATPTPIPAPSFAPFDPAPGGATIADPSEPLKIDGIRFDPDFATNGKLHLAFSVLVDGQERSADIDPVRTYAAVAFAAPAPAAYRVQAVDGIEVTIEATKGQGRPPLDVVIDVDGTGSMTWTDPQRKRVEGAKRYIDQMRTEDRAAVMDFSTLIGTVGGGVTDPLAAFSASRLLFAMAKDPAAAKAAAEQVAETGNTNLYDSIFEAITYVDAVAGNRPRAVVVLTDGQDNSSVRTIHQVTAEAKAKNVLLMMLAFADFDPSAMNSLVSDSGGYFVGAEDPSLLEAQYESAVRTVHGNAQAIIYVPEDKRISEHMQGRITTMIDGQAYSGSFNVTLPAGTYGPPAPAPTATPSP